MRQKNSHTRPPASEHERPAPPPAPPRKRNPDVWCFGGTPGWPSGASIPRCPLNQPPEPTAKELADELRAALRADTPADIINQAAQVIEDNAECLRQSSTEPRTGRFTDPRDCDEYARDMHLVMQLRKLAKDARHLAQLRKQLERAQGHLVQSSHAYDQGCAVLNNALKNWP